MDAASEPDNGSATYLDLRERANQLGFTTVGEALDELEKLLIPGAAKVGPVE